jgi:hypothetical protein
MRSTTRATTGPLTLRHLVQMLEDAPGVKAQIEVAPLPPGDVVRTYAR